MSVTTSNAITGRLILVSSAAATFVLIVVFGLILQQTDSQDPEQPPESPRATSPFLNTTSAARYVGTEKCVECHADQAKNYARIGMGRSAAPVDPAAEPPDGEFDHKESGRRYRVYRKAGSMYHRESLLKPDGSEEEIGDYPVDLLVGSGRHSRTYIVERDGFLFESPITWYEAPKKWDLSPGFDQPETPGFTRPILHECLHCHVGKVERKQENSLQKFEVVEHAIGCERCHGPGSLHVERRTTSDAKTVEGVDRTIVNPKRLERQLIDAICEQCHLRSNARATVRGRDLNDFRPGLPFSDVRVEYRLDVADDQMTVTGHVEQLHQSRCYRESETMTCVTCHNPHASPTAEQEVAYYRSKCLTCHEETSCTLTPEQRHQKNPDDNCAACHMPQSPTDIPHFAFTHHRIGVGHDVSEHSDDIPVGKLAPLHDVSRLSQLDRDRCLGLAYVELSDRCRDEDTKSLYVRRAESLLHKVRDEGLRDGDVESALARLYLNMNSSKDAKHASAALAAAGLSPESRVNALYVLGEARMRQKRFPEAIEAMDELTTLRYLADDWYLLAFCHANLANREQLQYSLRRALQADPTREDIRQSVERLKLIPTSGN